MADRFAGASEDLLSPSHNAAAVTTSDGANLPNVSKRLWIGGAGSVKVDMLGGDQGVSYLAVPAGTYLNIRATKVYATGTSATNIINEY